MARHEHKGGRPAHKQSFQHLEILFGRTQHAAPHLSGKSIDGRAIKRGTRLTTQRLQLCGLC
jgi:hypothetical protein